MSLSKTPRVTSKTVSFASISRNILDESGEEFIPDNNSKYARCLNVMRKTAESLYQKQMEENEHNIEKWTNQKKTLEAEYHNSSFHAVVHQKIPKIDNALSLWLNTIDAIEEIIEDKQEENAKLFTKITALRNGELDEEVIQSFSRTASINYTPTPQSPGSPRSPRTPKTPKVDRWKLLKAKLLPGDQIRFKPSVILKDRRKCELYAEWKDKQLISEIGVAFEDIDSLYDHHRFICEETKKKRTHWLSYCVLRDGKYILFENM